VASHEEKFKECCWCKETTVRSRLSQKAYGQRLEVNRLAKLTELALIVRTVASRINVVLPAAVGYQLQDRGSRQELIREDVRENKVVPGVRSVHQERASRSQNAGHLLKRCKWGRQMLHHHVAGDQIEAGVGRVVWHGRCKEAIWSDFHLVLRVAWDGCCPDESKGRRRARGTLVSMQVIS
jgi:hypothetical protein